DDSVCRQADGGRNLGVAHPRHRHIQSGQASALCQVLDVGDARLRPGWCGCPVLSQHCNRRPQLSQCPLSRLPHRDQCLACALRLAVEVMKSRTRLHVDDRNGMGQDIVELPGDRRLNGPSLLIIDERGYLSMPTEYAAALFQVISRRYLRGSVILTTNKMVASWGDIFSDTTIAAAMLD